MTVRTNNVSGTHVRELAAMRLLDSMGQMAHEMFVSVVRLDTP